MAEPEILFDVDASKILAKLHLGALEACKQWLSEGFFVNTGIKNDNPSAKPDNPGKVEFDITNGEYEVGYVTDIDFEADTTLAIAIDKITPMINKIKVGQETDNAMQEADDDQQDASDKPLLSKDKNQKKQAARDENTQKIDAQVKATYDEINKFLTEQGKELAKTGFSLREIFNNFKSTNKAFINWLKTNNESRKKRNPPIKERKPEEIQVKDIRMNPSLFKEFAEFLISKLQEVAKKSGNSTSLDNVSEKDFKNAFAGLQAYMNVFVGDKAKVLKDKNVIKQFAPSEAKDSNDKKLVANYEIVPADDKEIELQQKKNEANKDKATMRVCFKIGYSVQIDK